MVAVFDIVVELRPLPETIAVTEIWDPSFAIMLRIAIPSLLVTLSTDFNSPLQSPILH